MDKVPEQPLSLEEIRLLVCKDDGDLWERYGREIAQFLLAEIDQLTAGCTHV